MNIIMITGIIVAGIVAVIAILAHGKGCKVTALPIVKQAEKVTPSNVTINFKEPDDRKDMTFNGDADFDEADLMENVVDIVARDHSLFYTMQSGEQITKEWKPKSRAESWTPEMKEQARRRAKLQWRG